MIAAPQHGPEEIIPKFREAEVLMSQGTAQELAAKQIGVSTQTLICWRKEYGGLRMDQAKRLRELEKENTHLKRLLAERRAGKVLDQPRSTQRRMRHVSNDEPRLVRRMVELASGYGYR